MYPRLLPLRTLFLLVAEFFVSGFDSYGMKLSVGASVGGGDGAGETWSTVALTDKEYRGDRGSFDEITTFFVTLPRQA